jgi:hypothetical protein
MIEDQSQIESRETERAIAIDSAMLDFLDTVSVSGNSPIFAVTPDATRTARGHVSAPSIAVPTTFVEERTIPIGPLGNRSVCPVCGSIPASNGLLGRRYRRRRSNPQPVEHHQSASKDHAEGR